MKKLSYRKLETFLFCAVGILTFALLLYLWVVPNVEITQTRDVSDYTMVETVDYSESTEDGCLVRQFRFTLDAEIAYDTTLMFRFHHQSARVYLDGQEVYSLTTSPQLRILRTPGSSWAMIPLYREDAGKEVLVELRPVYANYQHQEITFYIGSKMAMYAGLLANALPEIFLCLADVFAGLLLFIIALYLSTRKNRQGSGLYALSALSISLGLWNFTQSSFALLVFPEKNAFLYTVSVTMLAIAVIALIKSVRKPKKPFSRKMLNGWTIFYCIFLIWQLLFQLLGILDLRQTLKGIHAALIITSSILILGSIMDWWNARRVTGEAQKVDVIWILGVAVLLDLLNYYLGSSSSKLMFVLLGVFAYVLLGGYQLLVSYFRQRQVLEEKETQLTMSRITTMMSQIRSHFVFNVLNAISGMCKYDPEKADETVVRFSRYLRSNIDIMEDDKNVPFLQEMERLEDYVLLEQIRFGDRIEFTTDIEADHFSIPPLILQPIVENAIKHGISKRREGGRITLSTRDTGNQIVITVTDNGIGFPMEALDKATSVGLRNIRFRLYHLVGGIMDIKSQLGVGTTVTLTIPKEETHESDLHRR